jgi:GntR family transcriptional repressor for pyruvate dehydrogenase complex
MVTQPDERQGKTLTGSAVGHFQLETINRTSDRVADQIRTYIVNEGLEEGTRLPSERQLAELVGSSRPTVSHALRILAVQGLVTIRPGAGAFVLRNPSTMVDASIELMLRLEPNSIPEAADLRFLLELTAGRQALARGDLDLTALNHALDDLRLARGSASEWIAADTVFHLEIVRLAGNRYLANLFNSVHTAVVGKAYESWVSSRRVPRWLAGAEFGRQIALHEPIALAISRGSRGEFERVEVAHQEALLAHMGLAVPDWDRMI